MNCAEIFFAILNIIVLGITVYVIVRLPIDAVNAEHKLQECQKDWDAKRNLFLTLMA